MAPAHLIAILSTVPDPRVERTRRHKLVDILVIVMLAMINGAAGWEDIADFAEAIRLDPNDPTTHYNRG